MNYYIYIYYRSNPTLNNTGWKSDKQLKSPWMILEAVGGQCQATHPQTIQYCLVGGLEPVLFFHRLGMSSSRLTNSYFSKGLFCHQSVVWVVYPFGDVIADLRHFNLVLFAWWFGTRSADIDDRLLLGTQNHRSGWWYEDWHIPVYGTIFADGHLALQAWVSLCARG